MLLFEVIKGARPGAKYLTDHLLSMIVTGAAAAEFVLWPRFGTSAYFLLVLLSLVDFLSGLALRARRGTVVAPAAVAPASRRSARQAQAEAPAAELHIDPAPAQAPAPPPASPVPGAAAAAESVLPDHPEPTPAQPAVPSPGLQPGGSPPPGYAPALILLR